MSDQSTVLDTAFDVESEDGTASDLLPKGRYTAEIVKATVGPIKSGAGQMVKLGWRVTEGEHDNRWLWQNIIIQHSSDKAQSFGRRKFKDVAVACGITSPITDLDVLLYKPCKITVAVEQDDAGQYPPKNVVTMAMPLVANWNGDHKKMLKEASTVPVGKKENVELNDDVPF